MTRQDIMQMDEKIILKEMAKIRIMFYMPKIVPSSGGIIYGWLNKEAEFVYEKYMHMLNDLKNSEHRRCS